MLQDSKSSKLTLIVDDECPIRTILAQALRLAGYRIRVVETGEETFELFARDHEQIGLVIYDWNRPDISGEKVVAEIARINCNVPIVVSTGSGASAHLSTLYPTIVAQLLKPYDLRNVLRELGEYHCIPRPYLRENHRRPFEKPGWGYPGPGHSLETGRSSGLRRSSSRWNLYCDRTGQKVKRKGGPISLLQR